MFLEASELGSKVFAKEKRINGSTALGDYVYMCVKK